MLTAAAVIAIYAGGFSCNGGGDSEGGGGESADDVDEISVTWFLSHAT